MKSSPPVGDRRHSPSAHADFRRNLSLRELSFLEQPIDLFDE
jgi:hypothetical protein